MKSSLIFLLMLCDLARGNKETQCFVTDQGSLRCEFSENVNQTGKDFVAYFYPDHGNEERLVDCGWMRKKLECVTQEGLECKQPVSDTAVISMPRRFIDQPGSYKCVIGGYKPDTIPSCRFDQVQTENKNKEAGRETKTVSDGNQERRFPFHQNKSSSLPVLPTALILPLVPVLVVLLVGVALKVPDLLSIVRAKVSKRRNQTEPENRAAEELTPLSCNPEI